MNDECFNSKLIIEGEYIEGKVNGIGKEYDKKWQLIFEGEYLNDKRWNGKRYIYMIILKC